MIKQIKIILVSVVMHLATVASSQEIRTLGMTPFGLQITYCSNNLHGPAYIKVGDDTIFQTRSNQGEGGLLDSAGTPYSNHPTQRDSSNRKIILRWIIESYSKEKFEQYMIDFTSRNPVVVGPFFGSQDLFTVAGDFVQFVYWGEKFAKIEFKYKRSYNYYYDTKNLVEN